MCKRSKILTCINCQQAKNAKNAKNAKKCHRYVCECGKNLACSEALALALTILQPQLLRMLSITGIGFSRILLAAGIFFYMGLPVDRWRAS